MRLCRIPIHFFGNRMVVVHPSLSKGIGTRSAEAFWDERIAGFLPGEKPPKIQFWRLKPSLWYFHFYFKEVSLSIEYHMIDAYLLKVSKEHIVQRARVPEIASSGTYTLYRKSSILFFQSNCIFHLNIVGTRQATIHNRITEKSVARNDEVISSHTCPSVKLS